ncbi:ion channel [Aerosakkonema sp. BLCC-F183]|uniref:ion channel n=1 Tax=Aerosakkonema sp. BLCC-F183 TaxID=3342834 RepID=UPI0035B90D70
MKKDRHRLKLPRLANLYISLGGSHDRRFNVIRKGSSHSHWRDSYHWLLTLSWPKFLAVIVLFYCAANGLFALAYLAGGDCIANARTGSFFDAFFFSVQTMASIGYGAMYPKTDYANFVVAIEALIGLMALSMGTGLMFARFSQPTARVLFSRNAVIAPHNGVPTLMFRTANERHNQILEAQVRVSLMRDEVTLEGQHLRRFHDLKLIRSSSPIFALTWTVMHQINETSPLFGATPESLANNNIEFIVMLTGLDETVAQTIHSRHYYTAEDILWNMRFVDVFSRTPDGRRAIDYSHFHDVVVMQDNNR